MSSLRIVEAEEYFLKLEEVGGSDNFLRILMKKDGCVELNRADGDDDFIHICNFPAFLRMLESARAQAEAYPGFEGYSR